MNRLEYCGKIVTKSCTTPISTIVYLADRLDEFKNCLYELKKANPSIEYLYCVHKGEYGDKNHIHLLLYSNANNGFKNCSKLRDYFILNDNEKSYAKNFIVTKSLGDAYRYLYHDKAYLDSKNETREFYYQENDVVGSDVLRDLCLSNCFIDSQINNTTNLISIVENGLDNGLSYIEIVNQMPNKTPTDYVQSFKLIELVEKNRDCTLRNVSIVYSYLEFILGQNISFNSILIDDIKKRYQHKKLSLQGWELPKPINKYNKTIDVLIEKLMTIDLFDFLFNDNISFLS